MFLVVYQLTNHYLGAQLYVLFLKQFYLILDGIGFEGMQSVHMSVYMKINIKF